MSRQRDDFWTPEEERLFRHLPGVTQPDPALEERLTRVLIREGVLGRQRHRVHGWQLAIGAAAASFILGVIVGNEAAARDTRTQTAATALAAAPDAANPAAPARSDSAPATVIRFVGM